MFFHSVTIHKGSSYFGLTILCLLKSSSYFPDFMPNNIFCFFFLALTEFHCKPFTALYYFELLCGSLSHPLGGGIMFLI